MSRASMPFALMALSTAVICLALASLAARASLPWLVTPMRIIAVSGATATVASPVTVTSRSSASAGSGAAVSVATRRANRMRAGGMIISPERRY